MSSAESALPAPPHVDDEAAMTHTSSRQCSALPHSTAAFVVASPAQLTSTSANAGTLPRSLCDESHPTAAPQIELHTERPRIGRVHTADFGQPEDGQSMQTEPPASPDPCIANHVRNRPVNRLRSPGLSAAQRAGRQMPWEQNIARPRQDAQAMPLPGRHTPPRRTTLVRPKPSPWQLVEPRREERLIEDHESRSIQSRVGLNRTANPSSNCLRALAAEPAGGVSRSASPSASGSSARTPPRRPPVPGNDMRKPSDVGNGWNSETLSLAVHVGHGDVPSMASTPTWEESVDSEGNNASHLQQLVKRQQKRIEFLEGRHRQALVDLRQSRQELATAHQQRLSEADKASQLEQLLSEIQTTLSVHHGDDPQWEEWLQQSRTILEGNLN